MDSRPRPLLVGGLVARGSAQACGRTWRDEIGGVQSATLPTLREVWRWLTHDAFPLLFPLLVRGWSALGLGGSDVDCGHWDSGSAAFCWARSGSRHAGLGASRRCSRSACLPSIPPSFIGVIHCALTASSAILILLTFGLIWRQVQSPGLVRWTLASLAARCRACSAFTPTPFSFWPSASPAPSYVPGASKPGRRGRFWLPVFQRRLPCSLYLRPSPPPRTTFAWRRLLWTPE